MRKLAVLIVLAVCGVTFAGIPSRLNSGGSEYWPTYHIYVDPNGNDNNAGHKPTQPLKTIAAAISAAAQGDTIYLLSGSYSESVNINKENVTIEGVGYVTITSSTPATPTITLSNGNVLRNLNIIHDGNDNVTLHNTCIYADGKSDNKIESCKLTANKGIGLYAPNNISLVISDSVINASEYGIFVSNSSTGNGIIQRCNIICDRWSTCHTYGIQFVNGKGRVESCIIDVNKPNASSDYYAQGISTFGAFFYVDLVIRDCVVTARSFNGTYERALNAENANDHIAAINSTFRTTAETATNAYDIYQDYANVVAVTNCSFNMSRIKTAEMAYGGSNFLTRARLANALSSTGLNLITSFGTGSAFKTMNDNVTSILADSNELQTDWHDGGRLDNLLDSK